MTRPAAGTVRALLLVFVMLMAPLSGCFGEEETPSINLNDVLTIDGSPAGDVMVPTSRLVTASEDESLWEAFRRMDERGINQMPVLRGGLQVGTLTRERVLRVIRNQMEFERAG